MAVRDSAWQIAASPLPVLAASSGRCELAVGVYAPGPVLATLSPSAFRRASCILHFVLLGIFANPGLQGSDLVAKVELAVADFPTASIRDHLCSFLSAYQESLER